MLVLRRRSQEVIVFEGGLNVILLELADHKAWLGFDAPSIKQTIAISPLSTSGGTVAIGIRSPSRIRRDGRTTHVELDALQQEDDASAMLVLNLNIDDRVSFDGMDLRVSFVTNDRAGLEINVGCLGRPVTISVQSVSGIEARIGIDAPDDLRVMRKELWLDLVDANQSAALWSTDEMESLRVPTEQPLESAE